MGLQRKNHGLTLGSVGGHDRIRHHIRRDRERLVVNKFAVNSGARGVQHFAAAGANNNGALGGARWPQSTRGRVGQALSFPRQDFALRGRLACIEAASRK